jgi:hypothetical protein
MELAMLAMLFTFLPLVCMKVATQANALLDSLQNFNATLESVQLWAVAAWIFALCFLVELSRIDLKAKIRKMQAKHDAEMDAMQARHDEEMDAMQAEHDEEMDDSQDQYNSCRYVYEEANKKVVEYKQIIENLNVAIFVLLAVIVVLVPKE